MSSVKKLWWASLVVAFGVCAFPGKASATSCPVSPNPGDNVYTVNGTGTTSVPSCVTEYGGGNLNGKTGGQGGGNDDFLDGPTDDSTVTDGGTYFGGDWTSFCTTDDANPANNTTNTCKTAYNFQFTTNGGGTSGTFSFTGVVGEEYALGVKDGSDPFWAVFLLSNTGTSYTGTWSILNGSLSHFAIYDRETVTETVQPETPVPEPASLLLLGSGLALAGQQFRRRRQAQRL